MHSDRFKIMYLPARSTHPSSSSKIVDRLVILTTGALIIALLTGCSNAQVRRTPVTDLGEAWFCEMNETRDDWDCVRDEALAKNPKPKRLPSDPPEPDPFAEELPALPENAAPAAGLANPSAAIDFEAIEDAVVRTDRVQALLALPPEQYVVQLAATETQALADGFVSNHDLSSTEGAFTLELGQDDTLYYVVVYGPYETIDEAQAAANARPASLEDVKPWIRPLESIQIGILEAEAIRSGSNLPADLSSEG